MERPIRSLTLTAGSIVKARILRGFQAMVTQTGVLYWRTFTPVELDEWVTPFNEKLDAVLITAVPHKDFVTQMFEGFPENSGIEILPGFLSPGAVIAPGQGVHFRIVSEETGPKPTFTLMHEILNAANQRR